VKRFISKFNDNFVTVVWRRRGARLGGNPCLLNDVGVIPNPRFPASGQKVVDHLSPELQALSLKRFTL
jgi:hypothetical protein